MLKRLPGSAAIHVRLLLPALLLTLNLPHAHAAPKADPTTEGTGTRVETMYTTWDDYYFYAAFRVHDPAVYGTNTTTTSQPQQDDDVEVFFETDDARAKVRTPQTFQMAVSAAQGAYFSVGDGTKIPQGKAVYSYKYAATVNGTLNKPDAKTTGYDVELAIPWTELGRSKAPEPGTTWGFNVISRDRESQAAPADKLYSLSGKIKGKGDVQNPSKWVKITFVTAGAGLASTPDKVVCAKVVGQFPRINGTIVSGDWPAATRLAFGTEAVSAAAPTVAEEPNTTQSPFDNPAALTAPEPVPPGTTTASGLIDMPNGAVIKVVPGGIRNPAGMEVPVIPPPAPKRGKGKNGAPVQIASNTATPDGVTVDSTSFTLGPPKGPAYIMGIYRLDYNGDSRKASGQNVWNASGGTLLADQPMNGAGPWFSGLRPQWHTEQLADLRRAGIEVVLLRTRPDDALLPRELDAFVTALKDMKAAGLDYPLVGVDATAGQPDLDLIYAHIPAEFRALSQIAGQDQSGVLVYDLSLGGADAKKALADGTPIARLFYNNGVASVSPGRIDKNGVVSRKGGRTYDTSWQVAMVSTPDEVVVDSWNDFLHGTEIAASRQYGEQYADATRAAVIVYDGNRPWHAKYLAHATPHTVYPKTLYQIPIRIENAGTLPWRAGEGYSLSTRWYRNGKLYDDSAPRIPVAKDVLPGQALTLSVGLVARDNFGEDLEPGDYTLVFDMVQSQDRWFSYAGDTPLQVPVTVIGADAGVGTAAATFLGAGTPGVVQASSDVKTTVQVRNDGATSWPVGYTLGYKIQTADADGTNPKTVAEGGKPLDAAPVVPGQIAVVSFSLPTTDTNGQPLPPGAYRLHWFVRPDSLGTPVAGSYDEILTIAEGLSGASFIIADLPRTVEPDKDETAHLALQNDGAVPLSKSKVHIGYHWYYLDGTEREWEGGPVGSLTKDLLPGATDGDITTTFRTPKQPGRYALVWDVRLGNSPWQSVLPVSRGDDTLQALINVVGKGSVVPVDLAKSFNTVGIAAGEASKTGGFDGHGATLPVEALPPDGTAEVDAIPLVLGKPAPPLYPSGYYTAQVGVGQASNHAVSFLYPEVREGLPNVITCTGQTIALPGGKYKTIHLLAAATNGAAVSASFGLQYGSETQPLSASVADWGSAPSGDGATAAFSAPYRYTTTGVKPLASTLGDYTLRLDTGKKLTGLTLPNDKSIKVMAISLEKE